jgi:RNA polymerase sigma-70 factor (ECF subfamily)
VVALNRAIALAELEDPAAGLAALNGLDLDGYHLYHAARADLLERLGRVDEATDAYDRAAALTANDAERRLLRERRRSLDPGDAR